MSVQRKIVVSAALLCFQAVYAEESDIKITPSASVYYQIGQVVETFGNELQGLWPNKTWDQRFDARLSLTAQVREHLRVIVGAELAVVTQVKPPKGENSNGNTATNSFASPREGQGIYTFGDDWDSAFLRIALGYFPFKYNNAVSHMGEYLFRTGTYPPYIINDFDNCEARLLGLHVSSALFGGFRQDVLFTSETYYAPYGDYSLSYLAGYKGKFFDVGGGICLNRLVPLDAEQTTIKTKETIVYDKNDSVVIENGDTLRYTFKGTKAMVRGMIDLKHFFPFSDIFGSEDCQLYFETAILGFKNYGKCFDNVLRRWPYMVGLNIPAFSLLDVLSLEVEYFNFNYDRYQFPPLISDPVGGMQADEFAIANRVRWSLFAKKTLVGGLSIKGLVGKDHFRNTGSLTPWPGVDNPVGSGDKGGGGEFLIARGDWHYTIRIMYSF